MPKTVITFIFILASVFILAGLARQIVEALEAGNRLEKSVDEVSLLQEENKELKNRLEMVKTPEFVEETARNNLNMAKPNETIVAISDQAIDELIAANTPPVVEKIPNWKGWMNLFFRI